MLLLNAKHLNSSVLQLGWRVSDYFECYAARIHLNSFVFRLGRRVSDSFECYVARIHLNSFEAMLHFTTLTQQEDSVLYF